MGKYHPVAMLAYQVREEGDADSVSVARAAGPPSSAISAPPTTTERITATENVFCLDKTHTSRGRCVSPISVSCVDWKKRTSVESRAGRAARGWRRRRQGS